MAERHLLVAGASGVIGTGAIEHFGRLPGWQVTALSRRSPVVREDCTFSQVTADLTDHQGCADVVASLPPVTHLVYAAVAEAPGLFAGWYDPDVIAANGQMFANLLDPLAATGHLRHVSILQGVKAYGAHHHAVRTPLREEWPRDPHPNFYWLHEDLTRERAAEAGFAFTVFRPQVLLGTAPGAAMNPVAALGAYAAVAAELGRPFAYPSSSTSFWEVVDTRLLAEGFEGAAVSEAAHDQIFNITNGDVLVPRQEWGWLAESLGVEAGENTPLRLVELFAQPEVEEAWARLVARHGLQVRTLPELLGESHHYTDLLLGTHLAENTVPVMLSTTKIRQAGFDACRDSRLSLLDSLHRMVDLRLLPPFPGTQQT